MELTKTEAKITVAKLLELAYSKDDGLTTKVLAQSGNATLIVDDNGRATLSGSAGIVTFSGSPVIEKIGVKVKRVSVNFSNEEGMAVGYTATFELMYLKLLVSGTFDLEALITSCTGLLCRAARALNGRHKAYDNELREIMGY